MRGSASRLSRRRCNDGGARLGLRGRSLCCFVGFSLRFLGRYFAEVPARQFGVPQIERARVRLLLRDANFREIVDQDLGLDLQLPGQLIDANLIGV